MQEFRAAHLDLTDETRVATLLGGPQTQLLLWLDRLFCWWPESS